MESGNAPSAEDVELGTKTAVRSKEFENKLIQTMCAQYGVEEDYVLGLLKEKKLAYVNISLGHPYKSQRDNIIAPIETCNTTSMAMGLIYSKKIDPSKYEKNNKQLEDLLTEFIQNDPEVLDFYKKSHPNEYNAWINNKTVKSSIPPNQMHDILSFGVNKFVGRKVTQFSTKVSITEIFMEIVKKKNAVVTSGVWAGLGHITCTVGVVYSTPKSGGINILYMINDDPYGNPMVGYKGPGGKLGNDLIIPIDYWNYSVRNQNDLNNKWCHTFL